MSHYIMPTHPLLESLYRHALIFSLTSNVTHEHLRKRNIGYSLREGPREYRPTDTYIGCGQILDFELESAI